ncbi:MAG: nicotinate (nicotinamide) nucleotide adenylyltransferase [Verrucomicrobia bacterium]|nr:nicotinate (nicotinamide) nucleotide adenylyltransferase [Verrucomicrobiota bacterium]
MMKIGMYGGSFDPIHLAHIQVAEAVCRQMELDRLYFIPAARSPFKAGQQSAPAELRLQWIRLAISTQPSWESDTYEIEQGGISYTIDTVREYRRRFPQDRLFYVIGMDHAPLLTQWKDADELAKLVEFVIVTRPGENTQTPPRSFRWHLLDNVHCDISSRVIRERIAAGQSVENLMPPQVAKAVLLSGAYKKY